MQPAAFVIIVAVARWPFAGPRRALKAQIPLMVLIGALAGRPGRRRRSCGAGCSPPAPQPRSGRGRLLGGLRGLLPGGHRRHGRPRALRRPARTRAARSPAAPSRRRADRVRRLPGHPGAPGRRAPTPAALRDDPLVWTRIAPLGALLVLPGLWGAIFSSAVGSMLGAPRTLQALALDGLAPALPGRPPGGSQEPVLGLARVAGHRARRGACSGDLNTVATVVTMFFLTVYGTVNLVAALEELSRRPLLAAEAARALAGEPARRPSPASAVMFLINPAASVVAMVLELGALACSCHRGAQGRLGRRAPRRLRGPHPLVARQARPVGP